MGTIFKRKIYDKMLEWKRTFAGRTALLIKGARCVGKSTIVQEFAKKEYDSRIIIDFSHTTAQIKSLFDHIGNLDDFFINLQLQTHVNLIPRKSVIIFDEVQLFPPARQAIKHLVNDGRYDYIETGSFLSIKKNVKNILIPSEETRIDMHPLDYEEFRWTLNDTVTIPMLKECLDRGIELDNKTSSQLMRDFRFYMLIGGMPQAIETYLEKNNFSLVDQVKRSILDLYDDDFRKIDPSGTISMLFRAIPGELQKHSTSFHSYSVLNDSTARNAGVKLADMKDSYTVNFAYHTSAPNVGFCLTKDISKFKIYLADTGLFVTQIFMDKDFTENVIYEKLLSDKLEANLGFIYENVIAQTLRAKGEELFYYTFPTESEKHKYKIDFLISRGNKICPIEVKSSGYKTHASLDALTEKYSSRISQRYLIYTKGLHKEGNLTFLPAYMTMLL